MKRTLLALSALAVLSGCSMLPYYPEVKALARQGVGEAIQDRKNYNDLKAEAILALPCDASLGAVMRLENQRQRAILIELCGGPEADTQMSVDDLAKLMTTIQAQ